MSHQKAMMLSMLPPKLLSTYSPHYPSSCDNPKKKRKHTSVPSILINLQSLVTWFNSLFPSSHTAMKPLTENHPSLTSYPASELHDLPAWIANQLVYLASNPTNISNILKILLNEWIVLGFLSLCRSFGWKTRLLASIYPIDWKLTGAQKRTFKPNINSITNNNSHINYEDDTSSISEYKYEMESTKVRALRIWGEVYDEVHGWIPVDPISGKVGDYYFLEQEDMESKGHSRLSYVLAFTEDECIKDVTAKYTSNWAKTVKSRLEDSRGSFAGSYWEESLKKLSRHLNKKEEDEREEAVMKERVQKEMEKMPCTISGFVNHPIYVLERHLRQNEVLFPRDPILGKFRGEDVFPRANVKTLASKNTWLSEGRVIKEGESPAKYIKSRAMTTDRKRSIEMMKMYDGEIQHDQNPEMAMLFGYWQTKPYESPPVVNGVVPKNEYGNIEYFHPSMLPAGGAYLRISGISGICKMFGIDFANAVVGFQYRGGRCYPVLDGVIVPVESKDILEEAMSQRHEHLALEGFAQVQSKVIQRWKKLVIKLLSRESLFERYDTT